MNDQGRTNANSPGAVGAWATADRGCNEIARRGLVACVVFVASCCLNGAASLAAAPFSEADIEHFEKQVRPLLAAHCFACHSGKAAKLKGGLRVDSRAGLLRGGDTGPAIVPGKPEESLLVDAIRYGELYQMPPKSKLAAGDIDVLVDWVRRGAPWTEEAAEEAVADRAFDLAERRAAHWCWQPIADPPAPPVQLADWPLDPLDRFVLSRLEREGWAPASPADPRALVRRLSFDLRGLPPPPNDVEAFAGDPTQQRWELLVDRYLESREFGERWARHWLDLVRYAESRGHEFDHDLPNAWQYRDYVIRAFNADVPYDQFLIEHVAGDLLPTPRRHPADGFNESILGTGFWYLGEWIHSPVDIRQDELDRFDNAVDVFSKTFLGITVACARCHDHKFDAISQRDYYALVGFLQSSSYRQARFDTDLADRALAEQLRRADRAAAAALAPRLGSLLSERIAPTSRSLAAAAALLAEGLRLKPPAPREPIVFEDFERGSYDGWEVEGEAFGAGPQTLQSIASYQGQINGQGRYFVNSHNIRDGAKGDAPQGQLTSRPFKIERQAIEFWVGGGSHRGQTCLELLVDDRVVRTEVGRDNNQMRQASWDVTDLLGQTARIRIADRHSGGWGNIGVDHIVFRDSGGAAAPELSWIDAAGREAIERAASAEQLDPEKLSGWVVELARAERDADHPAHLVSVAATAGWERVGEALKESAAADLTLPADARVVLDYRDRATPWLVDGPSFSTAPLQRGDVLLGDGNPEMVAEIVGRAAARRDPAWNALTLAPGTQRDPGALGKHDRAGRTLRTPTFALEQDKLYYLIRGACMVHAVVDSHRLVLGPLHGGLVAEFPEDAEGRLRWVEHSLAPYRGHRLHVEFSAVGESPLEVAMVVNASQAPRPPATAATLWRQAFAAASTPQELQQQLADLLARAAAALAAAHEGRVDGPDATLAAASWMATHPDLWLSAADQARPRDFAALAATTRRLMVQQIQPQSRTAPAIWDGAAENERLLIRGNPRTPGDEVPRRLPTALGGSPIAAPGSGRLELARQMVAPDNPLVARVMANRIWHHLMGRGIVPSVDNLGVLGEPPSHPELLDHLARRFVAQGWSMKQLIRDVVRSRTYQMSSALSDCDPRAEQADPDNRLLHRMSLRRLQGEAIRDAILQLSGTLSGERFGPSVPVHLTPFMQGRGRPGVSGPVDGQGRRSIYIAVRRNFLSPMMLAFDTPQPVGAMGRRNVSNVPAQALILMNDPFLLEQSRRCAERLLAAVPGDVDARIDRLYHEALSRAPSDLERGAARRFLAQQAAAHRRQPEPGADTELTPAAADDLNAWSDLCHVLWNAKEFIYLH